MSILVINAGSSSLKAVVLDSESLAEHTSVNLEIDPHTGDFQEAVGEAIDKIENKLPNGLSALTAVGHRVVHGGSTFRSAVEITPAVVREIESLSDLAPLHNPGALAALKAASRLVADCSHFAAFDTAFFAELPETSHIYPLPYAWYKEWGIRRFGFHGLSHAYCAHQAQALLQDTPAKQRIIVCHLGSGCSASAIDSGQPVATTMGFTPLEGLMMGTRSGSIDPGLILHLLVHKGFDANDLSNVLNRESGLAGISGVSSDLREIIDAANAGNSQAQLAIDMFVERIVATIGAFIATLGGVEALIFTGGIGENSPLIRKRVCKRLSYFSCHLDSDKNLRGVTNEDLSEPHATVKVFVVKAREDVQIAREILALMAINSSRS